MIMVDKYLWLYNTLKDSRLTFRQISDAWEKSTYFADLKRPLSERTFHRWREGIKEQFGVSVVCNGYNEYSLKNDDVNAKSDELKDWLVQMSSVRSILSKDASLQQRVVFDVASKGNEFLVPVIEAMQNNCVVTVVYQQFGEQESSEYVVHPYLLKQVNRRWHLVCRNVKKRGIKIYCLDRFKSVTVSDEHFAMPKQFNVDNYFYGTVGISNDNKEVERIVLKVSVPHRDYLMTLPIYKDYTVIEEHKKYSIISYNVRPTFEFLQQIFMGGDMIEVLEPQSVRAKVAEWIKAMHEMYV